MWLVNSPEFKAVFSPNLKFVVTLTPDKFMLYRDRTLIWSRRITQLPCDVISVANNGSFIIKYPEELYLYTLEGDEVFLNPILKEGLINQVALVPKGDKLFFERRTKPSGLLGVFAKDKQQQEIGLINLATGQEGIIYSQVSTLDEMAEAKVPFGVSYLALLDKKKNVLKLISLTNFKVEFEVDLKTVQLSFFDISPRGSLLMWLEEGGRKNVFLRHYTGAKYKIPLPPKGYEYVAFGKGFIAYTSPISGELIFTDFKGQQLYSAPLSKLEDIRIKYWTIFFPSEEDIIAVYFYNDRTPLTITYYDVQTFETEVKRWQMEYEKLKMEAERISSMLSKKAERKRVKIDIDEELVLSKKGKAQEKERALAQASREVERAVQNQEPQVKRLHPLGPGVNVKPSTSEEDLLKAINGLGVDEDLVKEVERRQEEAGKVKDYVEEVEEEIGVRTPPQTNVSSSPSPKRASTTKASTSLEFDEPKRRLKEIEIDTLSAELEEERGRTSKRSRVPKKRSLALDIDSSLKRREVRTGPKPRKVDLEKLIEEQLPSVSRPPKERIELDLDLETGEVKVKRERVAPEKPKRLTKQQIRQEMQKLKMLKKLGEISEEEYVKRLKELKRQLELLRSKERHT